MESRVDESLPMIAQTPCTCDSQLQCALRRSHPVCGVRKVMDQVGSFTECMALLLRETRQEGAKVPLLSKGICPRPEQWKAIPYPLPTLHRPHEYNQRAFGHR